MKRNNIIVEVIKKETPWEDKYIFRGIDIFTNKLFQVLDSQTDESYLHITHLKVDSLKSDVQKAYNKLVEGKIFEVIRNFNLSDLTISNMLSTNVVLLVDNPKHELHGMTFNMHRKYKNHWNKSTTFIDLDSNKYKSEDLKITQVETISPLSDLYDYAKGLINYNE